MNFFQHLRITHKISILMVGLVLGFILIGVTYYVQINISEGARQKENRAFQFQQMLAEINQLEYNWQVLSSQLEILPSATAQRQNQRASEALQQKITQLHGLAPDARAEQQIAELMRARSNYESAMESVIQFIAIDGDIAEQQQKLQEQQVTTRALVDALQQAATEAREAAVADASKIFQASQAAVTAIIFLVAMGTTVGIYFLYKSIVFPLTHMQSVIARINRGKTKARVKILSNDELADLGRAFNTLFDERIQQLESQSLENERLNNSIIGLIQALGAIANKDLTIRVPVSADITGTVSDAVNLLTTETSSTLRQVKTISGEVNAAADELQSQSLRVMQLAESERMQILATSKALRILAKAMSDVAAQAQLADQSASRTITSSQSAKRAVSQAVEGIREIRETISETEKRTKRLGDRSQEISSIVNVINTIAERTHILALNASMHAASAGEAGKGFAVVAEEVQRLAESARESTEEITTMINNMRVETSDTVAILNKLISQVADGSKLAEQAGEEMHVTEANTRELVHAVKTIAKHAVQQASVANRINDRATIIRDFTEKTEQQLQAQKLLADNLTRYAEKLVQNVNVFKLPDDAVPTLGSRDQADKPAKPIPLHAVKTAS